MHEPNGNKLNAHEDYLDAVLAEYLVRIDRGESVDRRAFIAKYPGAAADLESYFADADAVARALEEGKSQPAYGGLCRFCPP